MTRFIFNPLHSLRGRYLLATLSLAFLMLISAWLTEIYVNSASHNGHHNLSQRNHILPINRAIRYAVHDAVNALNAYVLSPNESMRQVFKTRIGDAIQASQELSIQDWHYITEQAQDIKLLIADLGSLREHGIALMLLRDDIESLFPAMVLLRDVLTPNNVSFNTAASLAHDDLASERFNPIDDPIYQKISVVRQHWANMIIIFRGYVALLTGTFGPDNPDILQQEKNIELLYIQVMAVLHELQALDQNELGFQAIESLMQMHTAAQTWYQAYKHVREIYGTSKWRADAPYMHQKIFPIQNSIQQRLVKLDIAIELSNKEDLGVLSKVSSSVLNTFWFVIIFTLSSIIIGYYFLSRNILLPLSRITTALRSESLKDTENPLPQFNTIETRQLISAFLDMRDQVQTRQEALEYQALHDSLTGLPNRVLLQDRLQQTIARGIRDNSTCALMIMDLDRFKEINDTLGHHFGDAVLQQVGLRLTNALREEDTIARLGGDEFAILLPNSDAAHARLVAEKIIQELEAPFTVDSHKLYARASLGITIFPEHGDNSSSLIQHADVAMYIAKAANKHYSFYNNQQDQHSLDRLTRINNFRNALQYDRLELHYQPKFSVQTGKLIGAEALLRWPHPTQTPASAMETISLAEQTGLIRPLTLWIIDAALQQYALWDKGEAPFSLSINLSPSSLQDQSLEKHIKAILDKYQVYPGNLRLEITENALMADPERARIILTALATLGINISLDDFGTGYSSLAYLKQLPLSELKIDKSFVIEMHTDEGKASIVHSTIDLAHNLGMNVVAEGVESQVTLDTLERLGCDIAQGFHLGRPIPADQFQELINCHAA